jgi:two-component system nitrate/nitrite response regulator NarL
MPDEPRRTRILLVDDHRLFREGITRLLSRELGLDIVGDCGSLEEALTVLRRRPIDLVLLDYDLGERSGGDFLHLVRAENIAVKVLIVTAGIEPIPAAELIHSGVSGIFLKRDSAASLAESIRDIMAGKVSFEQELFRRAMTSPETPKPMTRVDRFTTRERQVLSYVLEGLANKEIAGHLAVSESSVKATLQQLFAKTGVRTRTQLVRVALERSQHET